MNTKNKDNDAAPSVESKYHSLDGNIECLTNEQLLDMSLKAERNDASVSSGQIFESNFSLPSFGLRNSGGCLRAVNQQFGTIPRSQNNGAALTQVYLARGHMALIKQCWSGPSGRHTGRQHNTFL